jgi:hypothetical protein
MAATLMPLKLLSPELLTPELLTPEAETQNLAFNMCSMQGYREITTKMAKKVILMTTTFETKLHS